jgi:hypothetical protein
MSETLRIIRCRLTTYPVWVLSLSALLAASLIGVVGIAHHVNAMEGIHDDHEFSSFIRL